MCLPVPRRRIASYAKQDEELLAPMGRTRELIETICVGFGIAPQFEHNIELLAPILSKLTSPLPEDLAEYLEYCIPTEPYGTGCTAYFHDLVSLIKENRDYVPGGDMIELNMLSFAKDTSGNQYAYSVDDGTVYWVVLGDHPTPLATKAAGGSFDSLEDFLLTIIARQDEA